MPDAVERVRDSGSIRCEKPLPELQPKSSYVRLFPEADQPLDDVVGDKKLEILAKRMTECADTPNGAHLLPGYTYFGQFIDHDITWNRVRFDADCCEQVQASNFRSAFLDLDSVYGFGPPLNCQFEGKKNAELFVIGPTARAPRLGLKGGARRDVPFDGIRPVIGDRIDLRNTENLIVRQMHVVFLMFHNKVIEELQSGAHAEMEIPGHNLFAKARRLVTWTYQWLVWNDFLFKIRADQMRPPRRCAKAKGKYQVSLEFILAGFRFGHSMVQPAYALNCHHNFVDHTAVALQDLINRSEDSAQRLTEEYAIEWGHFFSRVSERGRAIPIRASRIDTHITPTLGSLFGGTLRLFTQSAQGNESPNLPYRTLRRGANARLASGQQAANFLRKKGIAVSDITAELDSDAPLIEVELTQNTPLWYYILKEAEVTQCGDRLGTVGSWIVVNALEGALQHDKHSYLNQCQAGWKPPEWILPKTRRDMAALISFAGAALPVEGCP